MLGLFETPREKQEIIINGNKHYYEIEVNEHDKSIRYIFECPQYLHQSLMYKFYDEIEILNDTQIYTKTEKLISSILSDIEQANLMINKHHNNQRIHQVTYDIFKNFNLVFVCSDDNLLNTPTYLVNHRTKRVLPLKGYFGHGKDYAEKYGYLYY